MMLETMLEATKATEFELWLTGKNNFRYKYYPEYKANRIGVKRPKWEQDVKKFLVEKWNAKYTEGCEADDMVGALQTEDTMIAHIDKDINMIPGRHFHWGLNRKGKVLVEPHEYHISPFQADYNFYYQMVVGDTTDNVKGIVGAGPKAAKKILQSCDSTEEMFEAVREAYNNDLEMEMNGKCLWVWRKLNDIWEFPDETTKRESEGETVATDTTRQDS